MRLTCTSFSFPLLPFETSLRQIRLLDIPNVDLGAHADGNHLHPDRIEADLALLDALDGDTDLEVENEHCGAVQDEPHDPEEDMGAEEDKGSFGLLRFDGTNYGRMRL